MIHQYKNNGYNIVLDVNSGSVHVVDDMVYDIIGLYENNTLEQITDALRDRYSVQDIKEAYEEIGELKEAVNITFSTGVFISRHWKMAECSESTGRIGVLY